MKFTGNIRTGSLQAISREESTGNIRTGNLEAISGQEIYR